MSFQAQNCRFWKQRIFYPRNIGEAVIKTSEPVQTEAKRLRKNRIFITKLVVMKTNGILFIISTVLKIYPFLRFKFHTTSYEISINAIYRFVREFNKKFKLQKYVTSNLFSDYEVQILSKLRSRNIELKSNFKNKYNKNNKGSLRIVLSLPSF